MGRDDGFFTAKRGNICFNPRARMGRDDVGAKFIGVGLCFNPRARMGRDIFLPFYALLMSVSIHAPAWGAT